jgi:hypothetical protein
MIVELGDHPHMDGVEVARLVDGNKDCTVAGFDSDIGGFGTLQGNRKQHRAAAGGGDPEIALSLIDMGDYLARNTKIGGKRCLTRMGKHNV